MPLCKCSAPVHDGIRIHSIPFRNGIPDHSVVGATGTLAEYVAHHHISLVDLLSLRNPTPSDPSIEGSGATSGGGINKTPYIIGGVLGGIVLLVLLALAFIMLRRRARRKETTVFYRDKMVRSREDMGWEAENPSQQYWQTYRDSPTPVQY